MVMPRSRSMSIRSRYCGRAARASTTPVSCSIRSASVDLPWSMCAMMQKFRMRSGAVKVLCAREAWVTSVFLLQGCRPPRPEDRVPRLRSRHAAGSIVPRTAAGDGHPAGGQSFETCHAHATSGTCRGSRAQYDDPVPAAVGGGTAAPSRRSPGTPPRTAPPRPGHRCAGSADARSAPRRPTRRRRSARPAAPAAATTAARSRRTAPGAEKCSTPGTASVAARPATGTMGRMVLLGRGERCSPRLAGGAGCWWSPVGLLVAGCSTAGRGDGVELALRVPAGHAGTGGRLGVGHAVRSPPPRRTSLAHRSCRRSAPPVAPPTAPRGTALGPVGVAGVNDPACASGQPPVVLLHGTLSAIAVDFPVLVPALRGGRPVRVRAPTTDATDSARCATPRRRPRRSSARCRRRAPPPSVDVVGFSQGGLVLRTALRLGRGGRHRRHRRADLPQLPRHHVAAGQRGAGGGVPGVRGPGGGLGPADRARRAAATSTAPSGTPWR